MFVGYSVDLGRYPRLTAAVSDAVLDAAFAWVCRRRGHWPTRWKLRRAVRLVNEILGALRLEKHPDKTFIGRVERGFDFLGYHFTADRLTVAVRHPGALRRPRDPAL